MNSPVGIIQDCEITSLFLEVAAVRESLHGKRGAAHQMETALRLSSIETVELLPLATNVLSNPLGKSVGSETS